MPENVVLYALNISQISLIGLREINGMANNEYRLSIEGLREFSTEVFEAYGLSHENASTVTDCLITADLRGVTTHGIVRVKSYLERAKRENWNPNPSISFSGKGAICTVDGDDGFGSLVGTAAMKKAVELAREHGVGICSVRKSSHFGMASYYSLMAAKEEMIGFCCTNGAPNVAPFGAKEGMLGTSPFAFAAPIKDSAPFSLDISCSVTAHGRVTNAKREGKTIPEGWAIDKDGYPTTDPAEALKGVMLPFGGHKGSGISMVIDLLCGILNSGCTSKHVREVPGEGPGIGHFFLAIDISAFEPLDEFKERALSFVTEMKNAGKAPGVSELFFPGEQAAKKTEYNLAHGIIVGAGGLKELCEVRDIYGISVDPERLIIE